MFNHLFCTYHIRNCAVAERRVGCASLSKMFVFQPPMPHIPSFDYSAVGCLDIGPSF